MSLRLEAQASQDGIYRFDNLTPGKYNLIEMIEGEGFAASGRSMMTELRAGQTEEINFRIEDKSSLVYGKLTEADGTPAGNIAVGVQFHPSEEQLQEFMKLPREKLEEYRSEYLFRYTRTAITDSDGNFRMFGLPPGSYRITAIKRMNLSNIELREHMQKNGKLPEPERAEIIFTIETASSRTEVNISFPKN